MQKYIHLLTILLLVIIISGTAAAVDIEALIASMTLDEKIGQMTQAERSDATPDDVRDYYLGSILSGGGSHPASNTPTGWADMHDDYQIAALSTRLGIPMIYGIDAVHGHSNVVGATIFPHNIGLGATRDPNLIEEIGRITALEVACTGLEWTFAPCVAVPRDERWGRTYEGFGEAPELQTLLAGRYVKGLQGTTMGGENIIACAKHFAGDGGTSGGVDQGNTVCDEATLRNIHMQGYLAAIDNEVGTIMPSYSSWNGVKMHENTTLLTDVLKTEFGFDGFLISDWNAVDQLSGATFQDKITLMVNAGVDMGMQPYNWRDWITALKDAVNSGDVSMARIDDAVRRILRIKDRSGLFDDPFADRTLVDSGALGSAAHRTVAREAVRKSLVLLKNDGVLPISKAGNVFVAGKCANNIGYQCGGWTISWQGGDGNITPGTTIVEGIQDAVVAGGGSVTFSPNGTGSAGHDVAIVVIGETPYAEGGGDDGSLTLDSIDITCLSEISDIPTVVVLISGRPLIISDYISDWNGLVAAWLPGTEGNGIADVLFGDYDFTGKLPHSWPRNVTQIPINIGDSSYDPLFEYGFGLDYTTIAPTVFITNPVDEAYLPVGDIVIDVTASDSDGSIATVEFYEGLNYLGEDTTAPYSFTWISVPDGCYTITAEAVDDVGVSSTDTINITVGSGCDDQSPFYGSPSAIPGKIEAEDFDTGGEGAAYHDNDTGNNGGQYRTEDVDIENCTDTGGGYNVGWMSNNEWTEYTIDVAATGIYTIDIRVASKATGGNFHIEFNGTDKTGTINVPITGGWQSWTTVSATAVLSAGIQVMRFANADSGDEYNINYFDISVEVLAPVCDYDDNGFFDLPDLVLMCQNWLSSGPHGDADLNGTVDLVDFGECSGFWAP
ncbi:MAG: glycoside hydrolase family 3 C-terminal domain-containing protein [Sedimentisphaerales bacterium]|nr:glycoside hydrolase family 3 C-terminal domain-containing protein [Sedimentisphaerales bacterium]